MISKLKIQRIMYPKNKEVETGDFAIFTAKIVEHKLGDMPKIHPIYKTISLKGIVPKIKEGDVFDICYGNGETNDFGTTYNVASVSKEVNPENREELFEYYKILAGEKIAKELIEHKDSYKWIIEKNDEELLKVKGIKQKKLEKIYENVGVYANISYALVKLKPLGLTEGLIRKICMATGGAESAVDICMNNAYLLIEKVKGIGFAVADDIALKCGMDYKSPKRLKSAILNILQTLGANGKSFLTYNQLIGEINKIVTLDGFDFNDILMDLIKENKIIISADGANVALVEYVNLEENIAKEIKRIRDAESHIEIPKNWRETIKTIEEEQGWCFTEEQKEGIQRTLEENLVVITGKAGSGKSTITNAMNRILEDYTIEMCCLSAKASQRLREVTGQNASTIHKLLGIGSLNPVDELYADIVIVDEASMVSGSLFLQLLRAIPNGAKLVILGDDGQLTAIGDCSVFADLLKVSSIPKVILTKIHRQAEKSAIITESIAIREQKPICDKDFVGKKILGKLFDLELYVEKDSSNLKSIVLNTFLEKLKNTENILEVQVIVPTKTRGQLSVMNLNLELQALCNPRISSYFEGHQETKIYKGDKVINMKNNYRTYSPEKEPRPIFNGNIGIVKEIFDTSVIVDFVGIGEVTIPNTLYSNINLAYAITVHSSQGSQWKNVICAFDMASYILLNVEIAYTAITRAEELCSFIVEQSAMQTILRTVEQKTKQTLLPIFL